MPPAVASPVATPEQVLAAIGVASRAPAALKHALEWAAVLSKIQEGQSPRDACYLARVPFHRWERWMRLGTKGPTAWGCDVHGRTAPSPDCPACVKRRDTPVAPFTELARAARWYSAQPRGKIIKSMTERAAGGDQRAAEYLLTRAENARLSSLRAQLLRAQVRQATAEAELAEKKARGEHVERHEVIDPEDPRWKALQRKVFGHERQGVGDASAAAAPTDEAPDDGSERDRDPDDVVA